MQPNDEVGDVLRHGTLGIGFIGGHNAMVAIYGEGHAVSKEAWQTLYDSRDGDEPCGRGVQGQIRAELFGAGDPGRRVERALHAPWSRKRYGEIPGVTDRDYYVNSFHVDVREPVSIVEKIRLEAPFHASRAAGTSPMSNSTARRRKIPWRSSRS